MVFAGEFLGQPACTARAGYRFNESQGQELTERNPYPATWAKSYDKGRVFYTNMGHREDVWANPTFQKVVLAGMAWITGKTNADITPNINTVVDVVTYPAGK